MTIQLIDSYIKAKSNPNSRNNSKNIFPHLVENSATQFLYECEGSTGDDYDIKIEIKDNTIATSCSCPYRYNYPGICKHVIAALDLFKYKYANGLFDLSKTDDIFTKENKADSAPKNQFKLENHTINPSKIKSKSSDVYRYYTTYKIESFTPTKIVVQASGWSEHTQTYEYDVETQI